MSPSLVTSVPAVPIMVRKLTGRKLMVRLPVNRSIRCVTPIWKACAGVRKRYPPLGFETPASGATVSNGYPSSPLATMP